MSISKRHAQDMEVIATELINFVSWFLKLLTFVWNVTSFTMS